MTDTSSPQPIPHKCNGQFKKHKLQFKEINMPENKVSEMPYEVWEEGKKKGAFNDTAITECMENVKPLKYMSYYGQNLIRAVPVNELMFLRTEGDWARCHPRNGYFTTAEDGITYRLPNDWQPPEKPKELVGIEYLESLPLGTILDRGNFRFIICEGTKRSGKFLTVINLSTFEVYTNFIHEFKYHPGIGNSPPSSFTIIWPNKQAEQSDLLGMLGMKTMEAYGPAERIEELEKVIKRCFSYDFDINDEEMFPIGLSLTFPNGLDAKIIKDVLLNQTTESKE